MAILQIKGQTQGSGTVTFTIPTTDEHSTVTLPAKTGTLALTSDIVETDISSLATKSELTTGLAKKAEKVHTHTDAQITGLSDKLSAKLDITTYTSDKSGLIPTRGNAGTITTSETIANLQTVNASSPRSMKASSGATVTLQQGGAEAWITVVACEGSVTVNLGNGWAWSGSTPTLGKGLITCAWYGSFGIVNFMKWGS